MTKELKAAYIRTVLPVVVVFTISVFSSNLSGQANKGDLNVPADWIQVFSEDFNGTSLNTDLWTPGLPYPNVDHLNDELEHYRAGNILISNGICTLTATKDENGNIYSGCITTKVGYKFGHTEARIKLPKGKGYWPAYWTTSSDGRWPPEWDILEVVNMNNDIYGYPHPLRGGQCTFVEGAAGKDCLYTSVEGAPNIYDQYVIFGFTWTSTDLYWYVNGVMTEHFRVSPTAGSNDHFWILLNLAVGGKWPGNPDETTPWP
jgi:beta-glucanase (GH16 family)